MREEISFENISVRGIVKELLHHLWMILAAIAIVWFGISGVGRLFYTPEYSSTATLAVRVKGDASPLSTLNTAKQMSTVFSKVFQSESLRNLIISDAGEEIQGSIDCTGIEETNLLVLKTTSPTPRQAYLFINAALEHYEEVTNYVFSNAALEIVQEPDVPEGPSNQPALVANRNLLALVGGIAMAGVIVLFYLLRLTVKNANSASSLLDGKILGTIPFEKRPRKKGKKRNKEALIISSPIVSMRYAEASRRAETRIETHMAKHKQKVVLVTSVGENEGKSTVAANIAISLAEKHHKVLLLDGDFRKPAQFRIFDEQREKLPSLAMVLSGKIEWREAIHKNQKTGVWELFQRKGISNPASLLETNLLKPFMEEWREEMDYIVIDCSPAGLTTDTELWMQVADTAVVVVRQDWADVRVINDIVDLIWKNCGDFAGFVLNSFDDVSQITGSYGYQKYERAASDQANESRGKRMYG